MATKFLVVETPQFQLGANAGSSGERIDPAAFPERLNRHLQEAAAGSPDLLFVLAPSEMRMQNAFAEAAGGKGPVSVAFFSSTADAVRFLPLLLAFDGTDRSGGAKEFLAKGSSIYSETIFSGKAVGTKLDPCFVFARGNLDAAAATSAGACLQAMVFTGLQHLPEAGEKGSGEKVDVQIGADEKVVTVNVRFDRPVEKLPFLRANPVLALPRFSASLFELRYVAEGRKAELTCLFFRTSPPEKAVEITTYQPSSALENGADVKDYTFRTFGAVQESKTATAKAGKGGFKKKFSDQVRPAGGGEENAATKVSGKPAENNVAVISSGNVAPYKEPTVVVSGNAGLAPDRETIFKNEGAANKVIELETKVKSLEAALKTRDELIDKANKEQLDPLAKRDVLTSIKDSQSEGLRQTVKNLETELEDAKNREKELMKMVDKAVRMKDDAAKKIKELDLKVKQASTGGGSKVQMLEKAIEEQKRQNKELSKRVSELNEKLKAA